MSIPISSPYIEVRMDTSGPYALVKTRIDTSGICTPRRHTGHAHNLHARFTRAIYTTCTKFISTLTRVQFTPPNTRTINARKLRVQPTRPTYAYNLHLSLARTCYAYNLRAQLTRTTYILVWRARHTGM